MRTGRDRRGRRGRKAELKAQAWTKARDEAKAEKLETRAWRLARPNVDFGVISPPIAPKLAEHEWWRKGQPNLARPFIKAHGPVVTR